MVAFFASDEAGFVTGDAIASWWPEAAENFDPFRSRMPRYIPRGTS